MEGLTTQATKRFEKLDDGWIKDSVLGIEWGPSSEKLMDWKEAKEYCADLNARLPESKELISLIDHSRYNPAIDTEYFDDTKTDDWYWSNTTVAGYSDSAWCVIFTYGFVDGYDKGYGYYVRPVRSSQ